MEKPLSMAETIYINAYRLLGLTKSATSSEIDDAFEKVAKQAKIKYEDKEETLKAVFAELRGARRILHDPVLRQKLNTQLTNQAKKSRKSSGFLSKSLSLLILPFKSVFKLLFGNFFRFIVIAALLYGFFTFDFTRTYRNTFISFTQSQIGNINFLNISAIVGYDSLICKKIRLTHTEMTKLRKEAFDHYKPKLSFLQGASLGSMFFKKSRQETMSLVRESNKVSGEMKKVLKSMDIGIRKFEIDNLECFKRNP